MSARDLRQWEGIGTLDAEAWRHSDVDVKAETDSERIAAASRKDALLSTGAGPLTTFQDKKVPGIGNPI